MEFTPATNEWRSTVLHVLGRLASLAGESWLRNVWNQIQQVNKFKPLYGFYFEEQFLKCRKLTKRGKFTKLVRLLPVKTMVLITPQFSIFGFKFGARVQGIHFSASRIIREFCSQTTTLQKMEPHTVTYSDLTVQGIDRFSCKGVVWFRARNQNQNYYSAAAGYIHVPRRGNAPNDSIRRVEFKWRRLSDTESLAAIGKCEPAGREDILEFIQNVWGVKKR